ncbi:MAG TPA: glycosyltransferase family 1 protein, partial [Patescibacteria group bacterium]|nr:glycosyltransferase family 1 protein [Patescibacteria group bacterium]
SSREMARRARPSAERGVPRRGTQAVLKANASEALSGTRETVQYIVSLSTIEPRKNIDSLLAAFRLLRTQHPNVQLVIVGGAGWKSKRILEQIQRAKNVQYVGYVDEQMKQELLKHACLFVYPSLYEGFGFPPLEAQAASVPVIVGFHSSLPEVLGESALYADVLDVHSLMRAMHHLFVDESLRMLYIKKGFENAQRFSWSRAAQQTLNILTSQVK